MTIYDGKRLEIFIFTQERGIKLGVYLQWDVVDFYYFVFGFEFLFWTINIAVKK